MRNNDLGYKKEQILHATLHMDELTPHIHCVVVPLVKKLDKRTNTERYTVSKKQYIKDKIHLSQLQDKYHQRLTEKGFDYLQGDDLIKNQINLKEYIDLSKEDSNVTFNGLWTIIGIKDVAPFYVDGPTFFNTINVRCDTTSTPMYRLHILYSYQYSLIASGGIPPPSWLSHTAA